MNEPLQEGGLSPAVRLTTREKSKPRTDKAQLIQAGRLHGRRENREIDELTAQSATLTRQLEDARAEVENLKASGAAGPGGKKAEKAVQKEMDALAMKVRRLEEDRDAAVAAKDALAAKVPALESSLATDARPVKLNADLDTERTRGASLAGKLRAAQEESAAFSRRLAQIEKGAETTAEMQMNRQKKEYNEKVSKLESMVASLEQDKFHLAGLVKSSKTKQDQLEDLNASLERETQRFSKQVQDAEESAKRSEKAAHEARMVARAREGGCSVEEQRRSTVRRYHDLVGNLHLSEDEVDALLTEGPSWPPIRAHLPESSLVDLLWLLTDRQDERDEEKHALEDRVANAEAEARAQKERADAAVAAAASAPRLTVEAGRANGEVDPARQEREKSLEAEVKSARENKARDKETISQLEARILAYEANASRLERSPSRASWGGVGLTVTSGFSQGVVDRFTSTITDLNQQVSELRDENTTLLLQLAGVDE